MEIETAIPIQQAAAVPYRWRDGCLEFCLITSRQKQHWAFPKGVIDPGEGPDDTALKEAHEEAGLGGDLVSEPLGTYDYIKWDRRLTVTVRLMRVTTVAERWPEDASRQRRWATAEEAGQLIARAELRDLLRIAIERIRINGFE
jgi:8-oxo-dGTP pyrophosphatase MutT (NUDIX family)